VFLNDALGVIRSHRVIPRTLRIHNAHRTVRTDTQALTLRTVERTIRTGDVQVLHSPLEVLPGLVTRLGIDAIRADADEKMPGQLANPERRGRLFRSVELLAHRSRSYGTRLARLVCTGGLMADKWNRDDDEPTTGAADERVRGVADDDDEFDDADAEEVDDEADEEDETTF